MTTVEQLREKFVEKVSRGESVIDLVPWLSLAALEYIAQGGLGHTFESFDETKPNAYSQAAKMLMSVSCRCLPRENLFTLSFHLFQTCELRHEIDTRMVSLSHQNGSCRLSKESRGVVPYEESSGDASNC